VGFYSPVTRAWEFAVGAYLALRADRFDPIFVRHGALLGTLGAGALIASMFVIEATTPFPGVWTLLPVAGTAALLAAGTNSTNRWTRALGSRGMVKIGDWSYSIYLWHWPCIFFARMIWPNSPWAMLCAAVLSIIPAVTSYELVEQPIRNMSGMGRRRLTALVVATTLPTLGLATLLWFAPELASSSTEVMAARKLMKQGHLGQDLACLSKGPFESESFAKCHWNDGAHGRGIYLVGDSSAAQFAEAVVGAGQLLNRPVQILTAPSCPVIANLKIVWVEQSRYFPTKVNHREFEHCPRYVEYTLRLLKQAPPGTVIVAALDQYWWDPSIGMTYEGADVTNNIEEKLALLTKGLKATVNQLKSAGHQIVIVQSIPTYRNPLPIWDPRMCPLWAVATGTCSRSVPIDFIQGLQRGSRAAMEEVGRSTRSSVLDLRDWFCDQQVCSTNKPGAWWYRDATHLTAMASEALVPPFADALRRVEETMN
jgi:SGNH domain (fused to AT3 domains)